MLYSASFFEPTLLIYLTVFHRLAICKQQEQQQQQQQRRESYAKDISENISSKTFQTPDVKITKSQSHQSDEGKTPYVQHRSGSNHSAPSNRRLSPEIVAILSVHGIRVEDMDFGDFGDDEEKCKVNASQSRTQNIANEKISEEESCTEELQTTNENLEENDAFQANSLTLGYLFSLQGNTAYHPKYGTNRRRSEMPNTKVNKATSQEYDLRRFSLESRRKPGRNSSNLTPCNSFDSDSPVTFANVKSFKRRSIGETQWGYLKSKSDTVNVEEISGTKVMMNT